VAWVTTIKYVGAFNKPAVTLLVACGMVLNAYLFSVALRSIPMGTAYAVWVGMGTLGTSILGILLFREPVYALRIIFLTLLVVSIIGLRLTTPESL
jgi:quaternary ammonium compound-resistance protein SugE